MKCGDSGRKRRNWRIGLKLKGNKDESRCRGDSTSPGCSGKGHAVADDSAGPSCSSSKREYESCHSMQENGLGDKELEEFLHSRVKRGRGAVGSRMDETGPYLPRSSDSKEELLQRPTVQERPGVWTREAFT